MAEVTITLTDQDDGNFRMIIASDPPAEPDNPTPAQAVAYAIRDIVTDTHGTIGPATTTDAHDTLGHDGWEHATLYHLVIKHAQQCEAYLIMPDMRSDPDDTRTILAVSVPYSAIAPCLSPHQDRRARGHLAAQTVAHKTAQRYLDRQEGGWV